MAATIETAKIAIDGKRYMMTIEHISDLRLGYEDHGIFTFIMEFDSSGSTQSVPARFLDTVNPEYEYGNGKPRRIGTAYGMDIIMRLVDLLGDWQNIVGTKAYVLREREYGYIDGVASLTNPEQNYLIFDTHQKEHKARGV